ncbi:MAG: ABC transporter permease [Spirochaetia bacterium]|jgi:putative spermidine/putrescine transport system permease protein|nr:ABC transporter permease [Spirochaetia bacterium]
MNKKKEFFYLVFPIVLVLLVLFVVPMIFILVTSLKNGGIENYIKFFSDPFYLKILLNTIRISLITTLVCLLVGYPVAYFVARTESKVKNIIMIVILFPFLVSSVVRSYGWMVILGKKGLLNQFLLSVGLIHEPLKIMYTSTAVIIGLVHLLLPYMIFSLAGIIQGIDRNLEDASQSLGGNHAKTFFKVLLPLSSPGILSGSILVFTLSMTSYVTPRLLGGATFLMVGTMVFQEVSINFNWGMASAISYVLLFFILIFLIFFNQLEARVNRRIGEDGYAQ